MKFLLPTERIGMPELPSAPKLIKSPLEIIQKLYQAKETAEELILEVNQLKMHTKQAVDLMYAIRQFLISFDSQALSNTYIIT